MSEGNYEVILCERGIRTFANHVRFVPDLSIIPSVQAISHLPIIYDPSHSTGNRAMVAPLSRAGIAVGADGLLVDIHPYPERALCDGPQALLFDMFNELVEEVRGIAQVIKKHR
jgi:3-deoxy-7-phosphoheptulonate synthase